MTEYKMDGSESSVYNLITELCEHMVSGTKINTDVAVKHLRCKAYEILLSKKVPVNDANVCLKDNKDPFCEILAWEYLLIHKYKKPKQAEELHKCLESLENSTHLKPESLKNIMTFLVQLKEIPEETSNMKSSLHSSFYKIYNTNQFRLPSNLYLSNGKLKNITFQLPKNAFRETFIQHLIPLHVQTSRETFCSDSTEENKSGKPESTVIIKNEPQINLWDMALNTKYTDLRTWETLRDPTPPKEPLFLMESSSMQYYHYRMQMLDPFNSEVPTRCISHDDFKADVKNLLVGIVAHIFERNEFGEISLMPGVSVNGLSHTALKTYCEQMIFCGHCYGALSDMVGQKKQPGYIFAALYESIRKYLNLYRVAALSLPNSKGLIKQHDHISKLSSQLRILCSISKVGPFAEPNTLMHNSVRLLNSLNQYEKDILKTSDAMIVNSVLYKCLQVYFSMFLRQWILEGVTVDPHNEFFITVDKYLPARGRTYWTRSYMIQQEFVPEFLESLKVRILNCGKAMNLLKLCVPNSPTCQYLMGKKPNIFRCCFTNEQLEALECDTRRYYLEVIASSGPRWSMKKFLECNREDSLLLLNLTAAKRAVTLKRIESEKLIRLQEVSRKKTKDMLVVRKQYEMAMQQKEDAHLKEFEKELRINDDLIKMQKLEEKIIKEEAASMIEYYNSLFEKNDKCQETIKKHIEAWKNVNLEGDRIKMDTTPEVSIEKELQIKNIHTSQSLDLINANIVDECGDVPKKIEVQTAPKTNSITELTHSEKTKYCTLSDAQKNKMRVMSTEFGIEMGDHDQQKYPLSPENPLRMTDAQKNKLKVMGVNSNITSKFIENNRPLTDAQKNKLRVMSTEFDIHITNNKPFHKNQDHITRQFNKNLNITETSNQPRTVCDNERDINKNKPNYTPKQPASHLKLDLTETTADKPKPTLKQKASHLKLDLELARSNNTHKSVFTASSSVFSSFFKSPNFEFHKPMSVDSTPLTDFSPLSKITDISTDDVLVFNSETVQPVLTINSTISTDMTTDEAKLASNSFIKYYIEKSIEVPLIVQTSLVENELLKHFVEDLKYLDHLTSLRNYFFLLDGEFSRNITEALFERLYAVEVPEDLMNCRSLKHLLYNAVEFSSKYNENSRCMSFKFNVLPERFDLGDIEVLDCLLLTYTVGWPLSILLPKDTLAKYDEVFKFLVKLHRVSWVLKKMFMELKLLPKTLEENRAYLLLSAQYQKVQHCRHIMTHFIQILQNYVVGEVLESSWSQFEENLVNVTNIDELYELHTTYIKNILFMCWLNQRCMPIKKIFHNIFTLVLKFHNYLRSMEWEFDECAFVHPNYSKLMKIFENFLECVQYLFKAGHKVAQTGYQPLLAQLLDMLDLNEFYTHRNMLKHI